jgi:hypothetical protein
VVEYRDRFAPFGSEYLEAALAACGRRLIVVDSSEMNDDSVVRASLGTQSCHQHRARFGTRTTPCVMTLAHRVRLVPTRFAYNWALAEWQRQYQAGKKPSEVAWYASFSIEVAYEPEVRTDASVVGVDLGITAKTHDETDALPNGGSRGSERGRVLANQHLSRAIADVGFFEFRRQLDYKAA